MKGHWVEAIHIDPLGDAADRPLRIVLLTLKKLDCSFEVQCLNQRRFLEDFTRGMLAVRLS